VGTSFILLEHAKYVKRSARGNCSFHVVIWRTNVQLPSFCQIRCANPAPVERFRRWLCSRASRRPRRSGAGACSRRVCHGLPAPRAG
jgi:hypothetical protein